MMRTVAIIDAPSSAGAYSPGVEKAPAAFREAGLETKLREHGFQVETLGGVEPFRWKPDATAPRAMNAQVVVSRALQVSRAAALGFARSSFVLVLGGDCTVEIGTVAGAAQVNQDVGLIYLDLDGDLNTPETTDEGALDWMGVAHMLALPGTVPELANLGPRVPLLDAGAVYLLGCGNLQPSERQVVDELGIVHDPFESVAACPYEAGRRSARWGAGFQKLLLHVDVDILNFAEAPLAENTRRRGLGYAQLWQVLAGVLSAPNLCGLTIAEVNPDHCPHEHTLSAFVEKLCAQLAAAAATSLPNVNVASP